MAETADAKVLSVLAKKPPLTLRANSKLLAPSSPSLSCDLRQTKIRLGFQTGFFYIHRPALPTLALYPQCAPVKKTRPDRVGVPTGAM
jgi:hypothetical protein